MEWWSTNQRSTPTPCSSRAAAASSWKRSSLAGLVQRGDRRRLPDALRPSRVTKNPRVTQRPPWSAGSARAAARSSGVEPVRGLMKPTRSGAVSEVSAGAACACSRPGPRPASAAPIRQGVVPRWSPTSAGGEDALVQVHPGGVVAGPRGCGVDTDQGQVHLAPLRGLRDQPLQQGLEDSRVTPLAEAVVDGRPGTELSRHLPPLPARLELPDHALELLPQPLGVRTVLADGPMNSHSASVSCTRVTQDGLRVRAPPRGRNPQIDHDSIRALVLDSSLDVHISAS